MKIFIVTDDYMPNSIKVGAKMLHELSCELVKQGNEVTVLTPGPYQKENLIHISLDDVNILKFKSNEIKNISKYKRAINESLLSLQAYRATKEYCKKNRHDLIIYYSPSIFFGHFVKQLKKMWRAKSYLILRDIFPQWAVDQGIIKKNSTVEKYFNYFENINYEAADTIGLMSKANLQWFKKHKRVSAKLEILPNWASATPVSSTSKYRKKLNLEDKVIYFYGGNMGHAQDMMNIVRLAKRMQIHKEAHFLLVGAGDEVDLIKDAIKKYNLSNITLLPAVSQHEFKLMLAEADVGLFTLHKEHKTHNFPGKLLGYMVQSMPILGSVNPNNDLQNVIEEANAGFVTINGEDQKLYENAKVLLNADLRKIIGSNAKALLDTTFSINAVIDKIMPNRDIKIYKTPFYRVKNHIFTSN